ncbi:MAG: DUF4982 domain-containing protein [Clostridia bacterium]|nr:DUF4982 domain-containing protein [Clostridia bacterium]
MRKTQVLKQGFRFQKYPLGGVDAAVFMPDFDDSAWRTVSVPHDWGIEGEFCKENDPSVRRIVEDGMPTEIVHTGRSGGLPTVGEGVYRKWVTLDEVETAVLELDGAMWESHVYVNGKRAGGCHFGYLSYEVDITDFAVKGENLIAVHVIMKPDCSRWYSGAGLYRNLRLVTKPRAHIRYNGVWVRQVYVDPKTAVFDISVDATVDCGFTAKITDPKGEVRELSTEDDMLSLMIEHPMLWDVDAPNLYTAEITLDGGDTTTVRFGARMCEFRKDGFFLNGRYLKMNGVCMHHDLGSIGAAVNRSAMLRQIEILKGMGVNAIRTSHNPPAPELLELCDEQGILVMDEFFDEWTIEKTKNGYHKYFHEHAQADVEAIIRRDRNHPSVIMWSIGNEIGEQGRPDGWKIARMLSDTVRRVDPTRPTTAGFNHYETIFSNRLAFYVDIVGHNYKPHRYAETRENYPEMRLIGSETESCVSTRGVYDLPAVINIGTPKNEQLTVSAYDLCAPPWAYYAERELAAQKDCPYMMGEFIWTGFDYMGEPTPYYTEWPSRSSYFGVVDLAGLPKNRYYCYRAAWTDIPTLHVFPHWNWEGKEGEVVPIHVYTNYEEVELFINGVSQGKRRHRADGNDPTAQLERYRLMWNDTVYAPGEVLAVAYRDGKEVARKAIRTAGKAHHIELTAYSQSIAADGEALNYVTATIVDTDGNVCPHANHRLHFAAEGAACVLATDAGDQRETECFLRTDKKALAGMLVCCLRSNGEKGNVTVSCTAEGLESATLSFDCI